MRGGRGEDIELTTLDVFLPEGEKAGLMKIDVEGHELAVLEGARQVLAKERVRDIVFEDFQPQPSPVVSLLQSAGYKVSYLHPGWLRPQLVAIEESGTWLRGSHSEPNFLATINPQRAYARFQAVGWRSLRIQARRIRGVDS